VVLLFRGVGEVIVVGKVFRLRCVGKVIVVLDERLLEQCEIED
jgi:hypothetical protein